MSQISLRALIFAAGFAAVLFVQHLLSKQARETREQDKSPTSDPLLEALVANDDPKRDIYDPSAPEASSLPDQGTSSPFQEILRTDADPASLLESLAKLRAQPDPRALASVLELSESNDPTVLRGVFMALGALGPHITGAEQKLAVQSLRVAFDRFQSDSGVIAEGHRYTIVQSLAGLSDETSVQLIVDIMKERPTDYALLYLGVESLGSINAKGALPFLQLERKRLKALKEPQDKMDQASFRDLQALLEKTLRQFSN
jgi:hypothetical protein